MRHGAAAAAALALAVAAAACGGSGRGSSYPEFQRAANGVCSRYAKRVDALPQPRTMSGIARLARKAYALGERERTALQRIDAPQGAAGDYRRFLDRTRGADELLPDLWQAASQGDQVGVRKLAVRGREAARGANAVAATLGLDDCRRR